MKTDIHFTVVSVGFVSPEYTASEMDCSIGVGVRLTGSTNIPLTLNLLFTNISATSGTDFSSDAAQIPLTFYPDMVAMETTLDIRIIDDGIVEVDESFRVMLEEDSDIGRVSLDQDMTTINIQDNDCKAVLYVIIAYLEVV